MAKSVFLISNSQYASHIYVFDGLSTAEKEKQRHISPAGFQGGKPACLDCEEVPYTHTQKHSPGLVTTLFSLALAEKVSTQRFNNEFPPAASLRQ